MARGSHTLAVGRERGRRGVRASHRGARRGVLALTALLAGFVTAACLSGTVWGQSSTQLPAGYWVDVDESGYTTSGSLGGSGSLAATGQRNVNYGYAKECAPSSDGGPFSIGHYPPLNCAQVGRAYGTTGSPETPSGFWFTGNQNCVNAGRAFSGSVFTWHVTLPASGLWHVDAYVPSWTSYGWGNHYVLSAGDGQAQNSLTQQAYHGQWINLFADHQYAAGQDYTVTLTLADTADSNCHYQMADQMRWVYDGGQPSPTTTTTTTTTTRTTTTSTSTTTTTTRTTPTPTGGRQVEIYSPAQESARLCGVNQRNQHVCHTWNTPGARSLFRLSNWWWKGTVTIQNYEGADGRGPLLNTTTCRVPSSPGSAFTHCEGFDYTTLYYDQNNHPKTYQFAIPRFGQAWGVVTTAFFISSARIGPAGVGVGDNRGFATSGVPPANGSRVALVLDFTDGIGVMRIDASCASVPPGCFGPNPIVAGTYPVDPPNYLLSRVTSQTYFTRTRPGLPYITFTLAAGNGAPGGPALLGVIDAEVTIKREANGNLRAGFALKDFPSTEAYQLVKSHIRTLIQKREAGWQRRDRIDTSPDDSSLTGLRFTNYVVCISSTDCA